MHDDLLIFTAQAPRVAKTGPVVGFFQLETALNLLLEQAIFVADAITVERQVERCRRIEEAGSQTAQTAVCLLYTSRCV